MSLSLALFAVPWPSHQLWLILAGASFIHVGNKLLQATAYTRSAYTVVVYPVVRCTGPFFAVIGAWIVFGVLFTLGQWGGVLTLVFGILDLSLYNFGHIVVDRDTLVPALALAVTTGGFVALYTTYDAYGIRSAAEPVTFLAWFFNIDGIFMPVFTKRRWRQLWPPRSSPC